MQITTWITKRRRSRLLALLAGTALIAFFGCKSTPKNTPEAALTEGCEHLVATIRAEVADPQRADRATRIALELQARERAFLDSSTAIKKRFFELNRDPEATRAALEAEMEQLIDLRRGFRDDLVWAYSALRTELGTEDWNTVIGQMESEVSIWKKLSQ